MKPGRPTSFTPEVKAQILDAVTDGLTMDAACDLAGVSRQAFYAAQTRARADPEGHHEFVEFLVALGRARRVRLQRAHRIITQSLSEDQPREVQRNTAFRVIQMEQAAESLELRRLQIEGGQRVVHSGSVHVITPERRAFLDELRKDDEAVRITLQMANMLQPERLARLGGRILPTAADTPQYKELERQLRERMVARGLVPPGDNAQGALTTDA